MSRRLILETAITASTAFATSTAFIFNLLQRISFFVFPFFLSSGPIPLAATSRLGDHRFGSAALFRRFGFLFPLQGAAESVQEK
jgi:hypothetical protein